MAGRVDIPRAEGPVTMPPEPKRTAADKGRKRLRKRRGREREEGLMVVAVVENERDKRDASALVAVGFERNIRENICVAISAKP